MTDTDDKITIAGKNYEGPALRFHVGDDGRHVMDITYDGQLVAGPGLSNDEATREMFAVLRELLLADVQAARIAEAEDVAASQSRIIDELDSKCAALEAENARLRERLGRPSFVPDGYWLLRLEMYPPQGDILALTKYQLVPVGAADALPSYLASMFEREFRAALKPAEEPAEC